MGIACASVGWHHPVVALAFPALMIVNAIFFHVLPAIIKRKNSPGLFTAVILFIPIAFKAYHDAVLLKISASSITLSIIAGVLIMAYPIVLLKTKELPFFQAIRKSQTLIQMRCIHASPGIG